VRREVLSVDVMERGETAFDLTAGALCLDFANTVERRLTARPVEQLRTYGDLLAFSWQTGSLSADVLAALPAEARLRPADAASAVQRAVVLREALHRIFLAIASGDGPDPHDLAVLNRALADALSHASLEPRGDGYVWSWAGADRFLDAPLWPVVRSAADLLTTPALTTLRVCAAERCAWLFVDTSRNGSRRWCDMRTCGNRAKARRHHARLRATEAATPLPSVPRGRSLRSG